MTIMDRLNKKPEQEAVAQPLSAPEAPPTVTTSVVPNNPVPPVAEQQPQPRPGGLSDEDYNHLLKFQTPEQISSSFDYKPGQSFLDIYTSTARKPQQVDEKKLKKAQLYSGIADSVSLLAQMFAAGKGAHVKERGFDQSATAQVNKRADQIRQLYKRDLDDYSKGYQGAAFKDITLALQQANAGRKEVLSLLQNKQKAEADAKKADDLRDHRERQSKLANDKFEYQKEYQGKALEETAQHHRTMESINKIRAAAAQNRAAASKKENFLYVPALPGDKDAEDKGGVMMVKIPVEPGQARATAVAARQNGEFMDSDAYKALIRVDANENGGKYDKPPAGTGSSASSSKSRQLKDEELAVAYIQWLREKKMTGSTQASASSNSMPLFPFKVVSGIDTATGRVVESGDDSDPWDNYLMQ